MLVERAANSVADVIRRSLGPSSRVEVAASGFRIRPGHAAQADLLGSSARVFEVVVDGWGPSFEQRRIARQYLIDLRWTMDELVLSILRQAASFIEHQNLRRIRGWAMGLDAPLGPDGFVDLGRLQIDVGAAEALHRHFGSDPAVRAWIVEQMEMVSRRRRNHEPAPVLRVHGRVLAVPFTMAPFELRSAEAGRNRRPWWRDDIISISPYTEAQGGAARSAISRLMEGTPLENRAIVEGAIWPSDEAENAFAKLGRGGSANYEIAGYRPERTEWRFRIESRLIGVVEAFC